MKKGFFFSVVLLFVLASGCVTIKPEAAVVYDETVPADLRTIITLPSYIRITKFNGSDVEWTGGNPLAMGTMSYAIPPGKHTFILDYAQPGVNDPMAKLRLQNMKYEVAMEPGQSIYLRGDQQGKVLFEVVGSTPPSGANNWWLFWKYEDLKDEWGEKTGKHQMIFKNELEGTYTKTLGSSQTTPSRSMNIRNVTIGENELIFTIIEPGNSTNVLIIGNWTNMVANTVLRTSHGEKTFTGKAIGLNRISIGLDSELLSVFSHEEEISFRITLTLDNSRANYQFNMKPEYFKSANERLKSLNTK